MNSAACKCIAWVDVEYPSVIALPVLKDMTKPMCMPGCTQPGNIGADYERCCEFQCMQALNEVPLTLHYLAQGASTSLFDNDFEPIDYVKRNENFCQSASSHLLSVHMLLTCLLRSCSKQHPKMHTPRSEGRASRTVSLKQLPNCAALQACKEHRFWQFFMQGLRNVCYYP